jgi:uncharacterized protein YukJ
MTAARRKPPNAQRTYGVLVGSIEDGREDSGRSPHYEILVAGGSSFRIAVNIRSEDGSDVVALLTDDFTNPTKRDLPALAAGPKGFQALATGPDGEGLDYLRDNLFDLASMTQVPPDGPGSTLTPDLDARIAAARADPAAVLIAFGEFFHDGGADQTFGFSPEQGVHDIHMMQGNEGSFADDNRVNGDGALFIRFGDGHTFAFFSRFTSQTLTTDPSTGNPAG